MQYCNISIDRTGLVEPSPVVRLNMVREAIKSFDEFGEQYYDIRTINYLLTHGIPVENLTVHHTGIVEVKFYGYKNITLYPTKNLMYEKRM